VFSYDNIIKKMPVGCTKNPEKSAEVLDKIISRIANTNKKIMVYPGHDPRIISQFDEMNTLIKP
jgi:hypothetical protein